MLNDDISHAPGGAAVTVRRADHVGVFVVDIQAAVEWYERVLGASLVDRWSDETAGMAWAHIVLGGMTVEFVQRAGLGPRATGAGLHHLAVEVADCTVASDAIVAAGGGVVFPPSYFARHDMDWSFVTDPFGNVLEIVSYRSA